MKTLFLLVSLALLTTRVATAWTYHDEDVLLVFRKPGYDNVLFNLGSISQFLNKPDGYSAPVTNFDLNLVTATFGDNLSDDIRVVILATTSQFSANRRAWLSSAEPNTQSYDVTASKWQSQLYSKINAIGDKPQGYTHTSAVPSYAVSPTHISSYDYIAANAHSADNELPKFGGSSALVVEQAIPATLKLWEIKPSALVPKPESLLTGTFTLTTDGALTFSTGSIAPPKIVHYAHVGTTNAVTFSTTVGGTYRLRTTSTLGNPVSTWPIVGSPVTGDGADHTIEHITSDIASFYSVERQP